MSFRSFMIAFISLLIAAYFLAILTDGLRTDDSATLSVLTTYLKTGVIVSFFLLGRYINSLNDKVFSRRLFNGVLILVVLSVAKKLVILLRKMLKEKDSLTIKLKQMSKEGNPVALEVIENMRKMVNEFEEQQ